MVGGLDSDLDPDLDPDSGCLILSSLAGYL